MFSTVVELLTLVPLGLGPPLDTAARKMGDLPVSITMLSDKPKRTEPAVLQGLVQGLHKLVQDSAQRLAPVAAQFVRQPRLPGWRLRIVDGNHLPDSEKRLQALRSDRRAALPGHSLCLRRYALRGRVRK